MDSSLESLLVQRLSVYALPLVKSSTEAAGYDLPSAYDYYIQPNEWRLIKTDISILLPPNTYGRIAPRSGLALTNGIDVLAGVIDQDFTGGIGVILINHGNNTFKVKREDRVAQLICERISQPAIIEVKAIRRTSRGANGFGSTGTKIGEILPEKSIHACDDRWVYEFVRLKEDVFIIPIWQGIGRNFNCNY